MNLDQVSLDGTIHSDGTLELDEKLDLPAGRVRVTVQPQNVPDGPDPARFWSMLEAIWADQKGRAHVPRSQEEIDAEIKKLRDDAEHEMQAVERLHEQCQEARRQSGD